MKIIDLLNKIANEEEVPEKIIKNNGMIYEFHKNSNNYYEIENYEEPLFDKDITIFLNDEVEIIEEDKKIEHLDIYNCFKVMGIDKTGRLDENFTNISNKINKIIDKLNSMEE